MLAVHFILKITVSEIVAKKKKANYFNFVNKIFKG